MGGKGSYAHPLFSTFSHTGCRQGGQSAGHTGKDGTELHLDGEAQLGKYPCILLERRGLLLKHLVVRPRQGLAPAAPLVDVCHLHAAQPEAPAQEFGAQHVVKVGHGRRAQRRHAGIQPHQPRQPLVLLLEVDAHKAHVGRQLRKHRAEGRPAQHGQLHVGITARHGVDNRHRHGHVTQGRKTYDKQMFQNRGWRDSWKWFYF